MPTQLMYFNPVQGASFNRITYPSSSLGNLHVSAPFILSTQSPCSHDPPTPSTSGRLWELVCKIESLGIGLKMRLIYGP